MAQRVGRIYGGARRRATTGHENNKLYLLNTYAADERLPGLK